MSATAPERVAVLIVRAWHEGDGPAGLRARITWVTDVEGAPERTAVAAGLDDILASVRRWLEDIAAAA
jgi:hypothetical protein